MRLVGMLCLSTHARIRGREKRGGREGEREEEAEETEEGDEEG